MIAQEDLSNTPLAKSTCLNSYEALDQRQRFAIVAAAIHVWLTCATKH